MRTGSDPAWEDICLYNPICFQYVRAPYHSEDPVHCFPVSCPDKPHVVWLPAGPLGLNSKGSKRPSPCGRRAQERCLQGLQSSARRVGGSGARWKVLARSPTPPEGSNGSSSRGPPAPELPCSPRSALGPEPGGGDWPQPHLGSSRGRARPGADSGRGEPPPHPPGPRAPLTSAHGPGGLSGRWAPPPLPQPGRAAGRRGVRAAAAAVAAAAAAASPASAAAAPPPLPPPPPASPPSSSAAAAPRPPPRRAALAKVRVRALPGRLSHRPSLAAAPPEPAPWHRAARPPDCLPTAQLRAGEASARRGGKRRAGSRGGPRRGALPVPQRARALYLWLEGRAARAARPSRPCCPRRPAPAPKSGPGRRNGGERGSGQPSAS